MKKLVLYMAMLGLSCAVNAQTFNEILARPSANSITLSVLFSTVCDTYVQYGTAAGALNSVTATTTTLSGKPQEIVLSGLQPNTRYYYRTCYKQTGASVFSYGEVHSFMTQRAKGSSFCFTLEADPHPYDPKGYHPLWDICLRNQLNDGADFMIDLGDTFGDDHVDKTTNATRTSAQVQQLMLNNRPIFGNVCHSMPFLFCLGNHEGESGYYLLQTPPENLATYETIWRKYYYPNPEPNDFYSGNMEEEAYGMGKPQNYYAFEWGDALFVVVDGWRYYTSSVKPRNWEWTIGKTQYDWLKQTLENSNAKYKFVFTHHVMGETRGGVGVATTFEWGGIDGGSNKFAINRPGWDMPIHQLLVKNHVNALFQGHDHVYAYEALDGITYQTVPMPSDSSYALGYIANASAFTGTVLKGSGHIRVTVNPDSLKVDFVSAKLAKDETALSKNGDILYSYSMKSTLVNGLTTVTNNPVPDITLYPLPSDGTLFIKKKEEARIKKISILDLNGRLIRTMNVNDHSSNSEALQLNLRSGGTLNTGVYGILITFEDDSTVLKMLPIK